MSVKAINYLQLAYEKMLNCPSTLLHDDSNLYFTDSCPKWRKKTSWWGSYMNRLKHRWRHESMCPETWLRHYPKQQSHARNSNQSWNRITVARGQCTWLSTFMAIQNGEDCRKGCIKSCQLRQKYRVLSPAYSELQMTPKFLPRRTQYQWLVFTKEVQVTGTLQPSGCPHIISDLSEMATFHLLNETYLWLGAGWINIIADSRLVLPQ